MSFFLAKNTDPNAPLLIGLMISKSLIDVGVVLESGAEEGRRGERGWPFDPIAGVAIGWIVDGLLLCALFNGGSGGAIIRERMGLGCIPPEPGVKLCWGDLLKVVPGSAKSVKSGMSSVCSEAVIGIAKAKGEDTEEGVDGLVV